MISKESGTRRKPKGYTISAVADYYGIHQQTLRMYERHRARSEMSGSIPMMISNGSRLSFN